MQAIEIRQSGRRFFRRSLATVLVSTLGLSTIATFSGCSQSKVFTPLSRGRNIDNMGPSMHGPSIGGPAQMTAQRGTDASRSQIRVTSENATPETEIEPVEQRLAVSQATHAVPVQQVSHQSGKKAVVVPPEQIAQSSNSPQQRAGAASQSTTTTTKQSAADMPLELPEGYDGVDVSDLMSALQDAPPEIQKAAIARLIAMSRKRAQTSDRPRDIEDALAASFDSLPELPDEVVDRGVNPSRIGDGNQPATPTVQTVSAVTPADAENAKPQVETAAHETLTDMMPEPESKSGQTSSSSASDVASTNGSASSESSTKPTEPTNDTASEAVAIAVMQPPVATDTAATQSSDIPTASTGPSTVTPSEMSDAELFDALVARLQKEVPGESDADRHRRQVVARHLMVLSGDPDRAVDNLEGLSTEEQEYLRHQLLGLWTIIDPKGHPVPSRRFSSALPEIRKATGYLAAASDSLEVRSLEFCTEIESYGQIKPFPSRRFVPGQEVILYCEIENFVANQVDNGFETRLQGSYDLLDQNGHRVSSQTLPEDQQISKKLLRDYFIAYQMYLPDAIEPGNYQLRLTMEDIHGKKYGQATVDFQIKR
ncbi:hypothetical protein [Rhodopirellula sallentina]|uniref:Putative secreted protein n=1 Tax=Rhodopirellula sallentina SM41 TaxID=1263870 RepID=M5TX51_9BACT|nr:hypothetical protein [Rhodopirellula sallentina]EMI53792.1 putative secreted protein [Rhodopirellula sallentina SM41]